MLAKCSKCLAPTNKMTIIRHLFECFNFGGLQCVHCRFGTNDFKVIEEHLADKHYNKPAVFCERPKIIKGDSNEVKFEIFFLVTSIIFLIFTACPAELERDQKSRTER